MTNHDDFRHSLPMSSNETPLILRVLSTPLRCHVTCGILASALIAATSWIWIHPERLSSDRMNTQTQIDDAIMLISIGDQLSQRFELADTQRKSIETRIEEITRWLPMDRSWDSIRSSLQIAAARCEVKLVAVDRANAHDGIRVSVFDARCEIQGTYQNICQFLHQIASQSMPMWCDEIRIVPGGQSSHTPEGESLICFATVSLRIPYAGNDTTAAKLLQGKSGNES